MVIATDQTQKPTEKLSLDDFLKLPETKPASEFSYGLITQKPMPSTKHSRIQQKLASAIEQRTESQKIALAFPELRCTFAGRSLVPDIAVIRWDNLQWDDDDTLTDRFLSYPDWTIEILSPDQSIALVTEKILFCLKNGSEIGWLIDPYSESILVFKNNQAPTIHLTQPIEGTEDLPLPMLSSLENWQLYAKDLFNWIKCSK